MELISKNAVISSLMIAGFEGTVTKAPIRNDCHRPSSFPLVSSVESLNNISCSSLSHRSAMSSSLVRISSLMPLNFFSRSPKKSSIASASFDVASADDSAVAVAVAEEEETCDGGGGEADMACAMLAVHRLYIINTSTVFCVIGIFLQRGIFLRASSRRSSVTE